MKVNKRLMPLEYTKTEGGELLKWRGGLVNVEMLKPHKQALSMTVNGIYIHMLDFGPFKWDCINGRRDKYED